MVQLGNAIRNALGPDISFEPSTPQAQFARQVALTTSDIESALADAFNNAGLDTAIGVHLENLVGLLGFTRLQERRSTATVTFTGTSGTVVPAGRRLRSTNGDFFTTAAELTLSGATGSVAVAATETGVVNVDAGTITSLVSSIPGITSLTNASAGLPGRNLEDDNELRNRFRSALGFNSLGSLVSVQSAVRALDGVDYCVVKDNPTASAATVQGVSIPAHALAVIVDGGSDAAIGNAISRSKPAGIPTSGATSVNVPRLTGDVEAIRFERVTAIPITVTIGYTPQVGVRGDLVQQITQILLSFVNDLNPGETLDTSRAEAAILVPSLSNYALDSITFRVKQGNAALPSVVNLNQQLTLAAADVSITQN